MAYKLNVLDVFESKGRGVIVVGNSTGYAGIGTELEIEGDPECRCTIKGFELIRYISRDGTNLGGILLDVEDYPSKKLIGKTLLSR
ncbi:hypothetical protein ACE6ED_14275 [Paenibacillus sp. CN-4]|uniref:hypothetical protein n=1 Tax=Paenibacillus nanchangensis TaxID=3348343 RepID=UPI00397AF9A0